MSLLSEFKKFALRGNVIDMAVGVIIGGAFGKIVTALVNSVIMPPIGLLIGGVDFAKWKWVLKPAAADGKGEVAIMIGAFLNTVIQFVIIALVIFFVIRAINNLKRKKEEAPPIPAAPPPDVALLQEIRDLIKERGAP
ncbi:large-conductance mechanosensitive channel protein MscL [Oleiagrimonas sp. C23AA]|uniref:large-conductance mechanosensitive channel protein MscL n=1 Tax=Oleiagrimonas sp. C23AA TaxID=2719047 RepID=UPI0014207CDB|nr:large-conductance mechanosensitive channel protein MscL [Oleiagrimonas sp. C23AA]NII09826.1 large-conductance mechanosensitive channel protein MscL [Oleiagrimonas sp. C23AA]